MNPHGTAWWVDDLSEVCAQFQLDLSCLVDGELVRNALAIQERAHRLDAVRGVHSL